MGIFSRFFKKQINPKDAATRALQSLQQNLGAELITIALYGSAARPDEAKEVKNVNLLVVVKRLDTPTLKKMASATASWAKEGVIKPMFFGIKELKASADVFPIEFLDMQESHELLFGEDPFRKMVIERDKLRHQLEFEIKTKLVQFRQRYLAGASKGDALRTLVGELIKGLIPDFRALLKLKRNRPARQCVRVIEDTCRFFRLNRRAFLAAHDIHWRGKQVAEEGMANLFEDLLGELEKLGTAIDQLDPGARSEERSAEPADGREREGRDRGRGRETHRSARTFAPKKEMLAAVKNLLSEIPGRKKWEPKEAERFQSDEQARDAAQKIELRYGWDREWLRFKEGKGEAPVVTQAAAAAKRMEEEEKEKAALEEAERDETSAAAESADSNGSSAAAQPEQAAAAPPRQDALPEEKISGGSGLDEEKRTIGQLSRSVAPRPRRERETSSEKAEEIRSTAPAPSLASVPAAESLDRLPEEKFNW